MASTRYCPRCTSPRTVKNGRHPANHAQKMTCKECGTHFRYRYRHHAYKPNTEQHIARLLDAGLSIRTIADRLKISPTTVQTKKKRLETAYQQVLDTPYPIPTADLHIVAWSGGKDSSALLIWALEHLPRDSLRVVFCDTGWESPLTYQFIEEVNHRLLDGQLITLQSEKYADLLDLAAQKGRFPSPKARFCTEQLKIVPMMRYILQQSGEVAVYQGIRAQESRQRATLNPHDAYFREHLAYEHNPKQFVEGQWVHKRTPILYRAVTAWLDHNDCTVHRPFFYWKTQDIMALCQKHQVLNPLYDMGFKRVGCFPCIMESKQGICTLARVAPERIITIAEAEKAINSTFFPYSKVPDAIAEHPTIADVVTWAQSGTSEATYHPDATCMSHYAQCS